MLPYARRGFGGAPDGIQRDLWILNFILKLVSNRSERWKKTALRFKIQEALKLNNQLPPLRSKRMRI